MKVTFTEEAIRDLPTDRLGAIIKARVQEGVREFEVVSLDEAIGRLSAMGVRVVDEETPVPIEVESTDDISARDVPEAILEGIAPGLGVIWRRDGSR